MFWILIWALVATDGELKPDAGRPHEVCLRSLQMQLQIALSIGTCSGLHGMASGRCKAIKHLPPAGTRGCRPHSVHCFGAQVMQSYLPGPSTYQLSQGTGIKCRAARERGQDIISLKVGAAVWCTCGTWLVPLARQVVRAVVQPAHCSTCALTAYHLMVLAFKFLVLSRSGRVPAACQIANLKRQGCS